MLLTLSILGDCGPSEVKPKVDLTLHSGEPVGHELLNGHSSNDTEELEEEDDSDTSSPPLPYLQTPAPEGCCTLDGRPMAQDAGEMDGST